MIGTEDAARRVVRWLLAGLLCPWGCQGCEGLSIEADRSDGVLPVVRAPQLPPGAIAIDGRLDEAAWGRAGETGWFVGAGSGVARPRSPVNARARLAWTSQGLLLAYEVHDAAPTSPFGRDAIDPHLWEAASGVELMLQPGDPGDNRHYYEVQIDVNGAVWDTRFDDYNRPITGTGEARRFGHQGWRSGVQRAVGRDASAGTYTVELSIPWAALQPRPGGEGRVPPQPGDTWRVNLYSFRDGQRHALAWSPILRQGNFHKAARFGRVIFEGR